MIVKDDFDFDVKMEDGEITYQAYYMVESEGVRQRRGLPIEFSAQEEAQITNFLRNVVYPKIKAHEGLQ